MLEAGGGSGYAGKTDWLKQNIEQMWTKLANQDTNSYWQRASQWKKTYELSSTHLSRLKMYRDRLTEVWPPEKNEAARAYVERLDYLMAVVQEIYDTAVANYQTVKNVALAIGDAKPKLKKLYDEYVAKEAAKKEYEKQLEADKKWPIPNPFRGDPPATQADLDRLTNEARRLMYSLSNEIGLAQMQIRKPPEYKIQKKGDRTDGSDDFGGGGGGLSGTPPVLPPVVAIPPGGSGGGSIPRPPSVQPPQVVHPITPAPAGPILGGTGPLAPTPAPPAPPPVITPPPSPTPGPGLPPIPPPVGMPGKPGFPGHSSTTLPGGSTTLPGGTVKPGLNPTAGLPPRAMPPGGLIGGTPGTGLGQPAPGVGAARRINPVGGVIGGGNGTGTGPLGGSGPRPGTGFGRSGQPFGVAPGARGGSRTGDEENNSQRWDPDNPWETDEGVAPVVLPGREAGRIDPGPAIGYNR